MDELVAVGGLDIGMVGINMLIVVFVVELVEKPRQRILDFLRCAAKVDTGEFFDKLGGIVGGGSEGSVGKMIDTVA